MPLKRVIGLKEALAINIGAIIGAGIFVISGLATGIAGPSVILAIAIGAFISVLTGLSYAQLAHIYSHEGGNYYYSTKVLGNYPGMIVGIMFVLSTIVGGAVVALSFGSYFTSIVGHAVSPIIIAAALIAILGAINYIGVKSTADISMALTLIKIAILAFFIIVGIFFIKPGNYSPFLPNGFPSLFEAAALVFFAYTGFGRVASLGEEVKKPKETIPKSIIYSIAISAVIYVLVIIVLVGIMPYRLLIGSQAPLEFAIRHATGNPVFGYIISIGALFATINVVLSMILGISRVGFAMARDGNMPKQLKSINRFGVPSVAIIVPTIIMMLATTVSFRQIASISNVAALLSYSVANLAAIKLTLDAGRRKKALFKSKYFALVPIAGTATSVFLMFFLTKASLYITAAVLAAITVYYLAMRAVK